MLKKTVLSGAGKGRSEEQISTHKFPAEFVKKALKEKSQSSSALKVGGPFAAIKESEKRKKMNGSLDLEDGGGEQRERAATTTSSGGSSVAGGGGGK